MSTDEKLDALLGQESLDDTTFATAVSATSPAIPTSLFAGESTGGGDDDTSNVTFEDRKPSSAPLGQVHLISCRNKGQHDLMCKGMIGGTNKFCLKDNLPGQLSCGIVSHVKSKFVLPMDTFFIKKTDTSALCTPSVHKDKVPASEIATFTTGHKTIEDWKNTFDVINSIPDADDKEATFQRKIEINKIQQQLKTPAKVKTKVEVEEASDDEWENVDTTSAPDLPTDMFANWDTMPETFLKSYKYAYEQMTGNKSAQIGILRDIKGFSKLSSDIGHDLDQLDSRLNTMARRVGKSFVKEESEGQTVWSAIENLEKLINPLPSRLQDVEDTIFDIPSVMKTLKADVQTQQANWTTLLPLFRQTRQLIRASLLHSPNSLNERIERLEKFRNTGIEPGTLNFRNTGIEPGTSTSFLDAVPPTERKSNLSFHPSTSFYDSASPAPTPSGDISQMFESRIRALEDNITLLKARTSGDGVRVGQYSFQSPEELAAWIKTNVKGYRFGYFLDGVSIWEFFYGTQTSLTDFVTGYHQTSRIGFKTLYESKVSSSFQNVLPSMLGKGDDVNEFLPGLALAKKWDNLDGASGLKYRISRDLPGVSTQVGNNIRASQSSYEAQDLAQQCLNQSVRFVTDLSAFITRFYMELLASKTFSEAQCWSLICRCVKRCFNDMADARVTAKDVLDSSDALQTATQYLWATLRTHQFMDDYVKANFEDHPSFASVITRFVTNNNIQSDIKLVESRLDKLETAVKNCNKRIDQIFNKIDGIDTRLKTQEAKA